MKYKPPLTFEELIHPYEPKKFLNNVWERNSLLIQRKCSNYWGNLLCIDSLDQFLTANKLEYPQVRLSKTFQEVDSDKYTYENGVINVSKLLKYFYKGHTIIFNFLQNNNLNLAALCQSMEEGFGFPFQTNIYFTPSNSQGFRPHYDSHCVFILQIEGSKKWKLYDKEVELPTNYYKSDGERDYTDKKPSKEFILEKGDMLYIPRGLVHEADTNEEASLHITLGALSSTWIDVFPKMLEIIGQANSNLRQSVPIGTFSAEFQQIDPYEYYLKLLQKLKERRLFDETFNKLKRRQNSKRIPILPNQINNVLALRNFNSNWKFSFRESSNYEIDFMSCFLKISCYQSKFTFPINLKGAILFMLNNTEFSIHEIPGPIDYVHRKQIIKQLVSYGLLRIEL